MMDQRMATLAARTGLLLLAVLSGAYALLAYLPFTYQAVIKFPMVSWLPGFIRLHPALFLAALGCNLLADRRRLGSRSLAACYGILGLFGFGMLVRPPLQDIRNDGSSLWLAVAFLAVPSALQLLDLRRAFTAAAWRPGTADEARRLGLAALASALFVTVCFALFAHGRQDLALSLEARVMVWNWSLWANLLAFLGAAALLMGVLSLGSLFRWRWAEPALLILTLWTGLGCFFYAVVLRPLAFQGLAGMAFAGLLAALGMVFLLGLATALPPAEDECALDLVLRPLVWLLRGRILAGLAWPLGMAALGWLLLPRAAVFDWNFLFQKTITVALGALCFAGCFAALPVRRPKIFWVWGLILLPILALNVFLAFDEGLQDRGFVRRQDVRLGPVLGQEAGRNVNVLLLQEVLAPVKALQQSIYRVLQLNSNIPREVRTDPVEIQHVATLEPTPGPKPDIFIFVVDSLRRDYLGAYNPAVSFTPELDRFAAEAEVVPNAFTRYGATGLSEPSIWTGSVMLHKQYITPFFPMNSLQKLLACDGYQGLVSMDSILEVVVKPGPWLRELDPGVGTQDLRLGDSLGKLETAMATPNSRPLFVYSQCQDLHVSVINREGRNTVAEGNYAGFYPPYASRLRRLDAAFGRFVAFLKKQGRYDRSIIIFTADHGDSLGEEGRFGHAYTLYPEIVRIPMLIRLPPALRREVTAVSEAPAFLVDLTPTLYYLLGHRPLKADPALGRPLFTATAAEQAPFARDHYLLASSYGSVFGLLAGSGKSLYIADGINFVDHYYALEGIGSSRRALPPEHKQRYDRLIVDEIAAVNRFYHFTPGP